MKGLFIDSDEAWCWYCGSLLKTSAMREVGEGVFVCPKCLAEYRKEAA